MKLLLYFAPFLKELFFDSKGEEEFDSPTFKCKRAMRWWLFLSLIAISGVASNKLMTVTLQLIELQSKYANLESETQSKDKLIKKLMSDKEALGHALGVAVVDCRGIPKRKPRVKNPRRQASHDDENI